jgi:hypothetical protein
MSEDGESPQPEEQQTQQQKVPPTFTAYPVHAATNTSSPTKQRILARRMSAGQRYISMLKNTVLSKHRNIVLGLKLDLSFLTCFAVLLRTFASALFV